MPGNPANRYQHLAKEAKARSQYWWLPYLSPTLGDRPTGSHSLTRDDFFVENSHFALTKDGKGKEDEEENGPMGPEIISKSKVEISSPKSVEITNADKSEEIDDNDKRSGEVKLGLTATPISEDLSPNEGEARIEPSLTTLSGEAVTLLPSVE